VPQFVSLAHFRSTKSAVKMHTLLDLRGSIPVFIRVTTGDTHDVNILDQIVFQPEPTMWWIAATSTIAGCTASIWPELSLSLAPKATSTPAASTPAGGQANRHPRRSVHRSQRLLEPQGLSSHLRRISFRDPDTGKNLVFLTNPVHPAHCNHLRTLQEPMAGELFFKWIKQHLRIKAFYGTSENAVKTQLWIAISVYLLVAIVKKRLALPGSLYTFLQVLSVTMFEKMPISQALQQKDYTNPQLTHSNQLILFEF